MGARGRPRGAHGAGGMGGQHGRTHWDRVKVERAKMYKNKDKKDKLDSRKLYFLV